MSFEDLFKELSVDGDSKGAEPFAACSVFGLGAALESQPPQTPAFETGPSVLSAPGSEILITERRGSARHTQGVDMARPSTSHAGYRSPTPNANSGVPITSTESFGSFTSARAASGSARSIGVIRTAGNVAVPAKAPDAKPEAAVLGTKHRPAGARTATTQAAHLAATTNSSRILVALHALETGVRVYARVGAMEPQARERLRISIRTLLAEHGLTSSEITFDTLQDLSETPHGGGA